jgi:hypothetical protein
LDINFQITNQDNIKNKIKIMKTKWMVLIASLLMFIACDKKDVNYVPIEAFEPSYKALKGAEGTNYDIEETVRILNGIELAQSQSESFDDFLEYMARQDYSKVAQEVVDLRVQLLPVLQEMYILEQEYENISIWNGVARDLSADVSQMVTQTMEQNTSGIIHSLIGMATGVKQVEMIAFAATTAVKSGNTVFENFEKNNALKDDVRKRIHRVRQQYMEYLTDYIPVYNKYMQEWNKLCLIKDRAYLQLYSGQYDATLKTCKEGLAQDPNNRELKLLQCVAMIQSANMSMYSSKIQASALNQEFANSGGDSIAHPTLQEANLLLDKYIEQYPTCSAPALLLKGMIHAKEGNKAEAFVYLDQAAIEYPRQAEQLTDMLSSYRARTYLNNTAEGTYLLTLYQSTMEGFGLFSPNFAKAVLHEQNDDIAMAREEIYNHFFRRSGQSVYNCLISDMEYCEDNLAFSFKQLLPENSYIDVKIKRSSKVMGMGNDDHKIKVTMENRSDKAFENIRLFLCIHYTDMYKTDYDVVKVPTLNRINGNSSVELGEVELKYRNKTFNDITRIRAIALTDNSLCWIDNVYNADINYNPTQTATIAELLGSLNMKQRQVYFSAMDQSIKTINEALKLNTRIEKETSNNIFKRDTPIHVRLPRIVMMLDPIFEFNENILPTENYLQGNTAHLVFKNSKPQTDNRLTIKSIYASYTIHFSEMADGTYSVTAIESLTPEE